MRSAVIQAIVPIVLLGVIAVPVVIPAIHSTIEEHEHHSCPVTDGIHEHDDDSDCDLCDYLISIQTFHKEEEEERISSPTLDLSFARHQGEFSNAQLSAATVRGPPSVA